MINIIRPKDEIISHKKIKKVTGAFEVKREWARFRKNTKLKELYLVGDREKIWKQFTRLFKIIIAAGGLVENKRGEYLFIFRNKKWDLPKGKMDKGESSRETAVREVQEECGIGKLKITGKIPCTYHIYILNGKMALKKTYWFNMTTPAGKKLIPQKEEGIEKVVWVKPVKFKKWKKEIYPSIWDLVKDIE